MKNLVSAVLLFRVNTVSYYLLQEAREAPKTKYNTADVDYNLNDEDVFELPKPLYFSLDVRESKAAEFHVMDYGFQVVGRNWIPDSNVRGIPESLSFISDSTSKILFGFWNLDSLTWGDCSQTKTKLFPV